jgi:hypothetical protein
MNEGTNRVEIGILDLALEAQLREEFEAAAIPSGSVAFVESEPGEFLLTLRHNVNPEKGGLQIDNPEEGWCTLGFIAQSDEYEEFDYVAVTNTHCTNLFGLPDSASFYQPDSASNTYIGDEIDDVHWHQCSGDYICRHSDTAIIGLEVEAAWAHIARTLKIARPGKGNGSINIDPTTPTMQVFDTIYYPIQGDSLDKIGRSTGWTRGVVTNTDYLWKWHQRAVKNAMKINFTCGKGDSGSPVFSFDYGMQAVRLAGIMFGTSGSQCVFSPWGKILVDYPSLEVHTDEPEFLP